MNQSNLQIVREHISHIMPQIEKPPQGKLIYPWLSVTYGEFYGSTLFTWDHHHAAMRFAIGGRPEYLRFLVDNLLTYQQDDGHTPSIIHAERGPRFTDPPYHAQPFVFQAAFLYLSQTGDIAWGNSVFDKLIKYLDYFDTHYTAAFGLKRWRNPIMGGMDNEVVNSFVPMGTVASADINGYFYIELRAAERMAVLLERSEEADSLARRARVHREIVNDKLWHGELNSYSAFSLTEGKPFFRLTFDELPDDVGRYAFQSCSNLAPLYARMAEPQAAQAMIKEYVVNEKHFWSKYGVRSLSKASEYYNNAVFGNPFRYADASRMTESNCQGPVWVLINYFVFHALRHYGFTEEARVLADRTVDLLAGAIEVQGSFPENYNSETGEPLYATRYTSWNLLADTLHDELENGGWIMDPIFAEA